MDVYKPNTDRFREKEAKKEKPVEQKEKITRVTQGAVRTRKKNKFAENFLSEDVNDVKKYLIGDILLPTIKKTISEMVTNGIDLMLFGEVRGKRSSSRSSRVSYRDYYDRRDDHRDDRKNSRRSSYDYEDIILDDRGEAELVLDRMDEIIDNYGHATITDLYDLVGYDGGRYTDSKYGWTSLRGADVRRTRDGGYLLIMPAARPVD